MTSMVIEEIIRLDEENPGWRKSKMLHSMLLQHVDVTEEELHYRRSELLTLCTAHPTWTLEQIAQESKLEYSEFLAYLFFPLGD